MPGNRAFWAWVIPGLTLATVAGRDRGLAEQLDAGGLGRQVPRSSLAAVGEGESENHGSLDGRHRGYEPLVSIRSRRWSSRANVATSSRLVSGSAWTARVDPEPFGSGKRPSDRNGAVMAQADRRSTGDLWHVYLQCTFRFTFPVLCYTQPRFASSSPHVPTVARSSVQPVTSIGRHHQRIPGAGSTG